MWEGVRAQPAPGGERLGMLVIHSSPDLRTNQPTMSAVLGSRNPSPERGDRRLCVGAEKETAFITEMHIKPPLQSTQFSSSEPLRTLTEETLQCSTGKERGAGEEDTHGFQVGFEVQRWLYSPCCLAVVFCSKRKKWKEEKRRREGRSFMVSILTEE